MTCSTPDEEEAGTAVSEGDHNFNNFTVLVHAVKWFNLRKPRRREQST